MFVSWGRTLWQVTSAFLGIAGMVLFLDGGFVWAGEGWETQPYGVPSRLLPWRQSGYRGYQETTRPSQPPPAVPAAAQKYTITVTLLPHKPQGVRPNSAVLMAHLPQDARIWFNDTPTVSQGTIRHFESPPLTPGKHYYYTARVVWHENGQWVHKTVEVPIQAGEMRCLYLTPVEANKEITANLAQLTPENRKQAERQKVCAVQTGNRLGVMGVPVKIVIKGQPIWLCCADCREKALADPDKTLAQAKELKAKAAGPSKK